MAECVYLFTVGPIKRKHFQERNIYILLHVRYMYYQVMQDTNGKLNRRKKPQDKTLNNLKNMLSVISKSMHKRN